MNEDKFSAHNKKHIHQKIDTIYWLIELVIDQKI